MALERKLIGEMLVEGGEITRAQLDRALEIQKTEGGRLGVVLLRLGFISSNVMGAYVARQTADHISKLKKEDDE